MDKAVWVKIVWMGGILAIPAAILAVQKPEAPRAETHRVMTVDRPVAVDITDQQIEVAQPAESAAPVEPPKPRALVLDAEKISLKAGGSAPQDPQLSKADLGPKDPNLTSALAPVAAPQTAPAP
jgi:hypothetical protein